MEIAVRYFTRSGNTEKLAKAVAAAVEVEALTINEPLTQKADILFLCSSYYAFDIDPLVKAFIINNKDNISKIVCVGSSAMMKSMYRPVNRVAKKVGIPVAKEEFHCHGRFKNVHVGKPDEEDLKKAAEFAIKAIK